MHWGRGGTWRELCKMHQLVPYVFIVKIPVQSLSLTEGEEREPSFCLAPTLETEEASCD